jgi:hypothetical protein
MWMLGSTVCMQRDLCAPSWRRGFKAPALGVPTARAQLAPGVHVRMPPLGTDRQTYERYVGVISVVDHV